MKDSKVLKVIGIGVLLILSLMLIGSVIVEYTDNMKIRNILYGISGVVLVLIMLVLLKAPKVVCWTVASLWGIIIFIGMIVSIVSSVREPSKTLEIVTAFQGKNIFGSYYAEGIGIGYDDVESLLGDAIENRKKTGYIDDMEEIYRIQVGEKIFIYIKEDETTITEYDFFKQDGLYYSSGCNGLVYNGFSGGNYTTEETIRKDIANTMWRGVGSDEVGAPAWGVSTDENISSMTINSENVDDVILIDEIDGTKYYFWITTNVDDIKTLDDVKAAEIEIVREK